MPRNITLRDVAEYAGVSVTTVSNVVRDWPYVSASMRDRVRSAIDALGYSPHIVAQGLRTGQTQALAFVVPDLSNPYFAEIVSAAEDAAQDYGYTLMVFNSHEDAEREATCVQRAASRWADGLLIAHTTHSALSADYLHSFGIPVVAVDRIPAAYDGPLCGLDNIEVGRLAAQHLYALGHRRIAHIAGPASVRLAVERQMGCDAVLDAHQVAYRRVVEASAQWGPADGYRLMNALLDDDPPTAVFASNDRVAIGALHALYDRGLRVPDDISLIGVDDIEISEHLIPPLTTIRQPLDQLARHAVTMLLSLIRGEAPDTPVIHVRPQLIVRSSTQSVPQEPLS